MNFITQKNKFICNFSWRNILIIPICSFAIVSCQNFHVGGATEHEVVSETRSSCSDNVYLQKYGCSISRVTRAAESGDPDAQYALGYMYYYGIGTVKDRETAHLWIQRASNQGQPLAMKADHLINAGNDEIPIHRSTMYNPGMPYYSYQNGEAHEVHEVVHESPASPSPEQPAEDVNDLNSRAPAKPLTDELPGYGASRSRQNSSQGVATPVPMNNDSSDVDQQNMQSSMNTSNTSQAAIKGPMTSMEQALLKIAPKFYTLQLMGSRDIGDIQRFINAHHLEKEAKYYSADLHGQPWYVLVYGTYPSLSKAEQAVHRLPKPFQKLQPWAKPYKIVQKEIQRGMMG